MTKEKRDKIINKILAALLLLVASIIAGSEVASINYRRDMGFYSYYFPLSYPKLSSKELCENCEMKIPKIIHRVWMVFDPLKPDMPNLYKKYDKRLKELHPDWTFMEWDDESSLEFIKQYYPDFLPVYYSYEAPVQRLDAVRYLLVHHYGGLSIQHSFYVQKNLEPLLRGQELVVSEVEYSKNFTTPFDVRFVNNNFFASIPKHPIISNTIEYLVIRSSISKKQYDSVEYILLTTGPILFSDMIYHYLYENPDKKVKILDEFFLSPFYHRKKLREPVWSKCIVSPQKCSEIYPEAYAFTIWSGSWMK